MGFWDWLKEPTTEVPPSRFQQGLANSQVLPADAFITWHAKPAGGGITIEGRRITGPTIKLTGCKLIKRGGSRAYIVAIDGEGAEHYLAV